MKVPTGVVVLRERAAPANPPAGHVALYSVDGTALLMKDDAGAVVTLGGGSKISALANASAFDGSEEFPVVQGGVTKAGSVAMLDAYIGPNRGALVTPQTITGNTDTYITDSRKVLPQARMQAGVVYRARIVVTKTAAGTATPTFTVRTGTAGTTADTSRLAYTGVAQTAVADVGFIEVQATFRVVGASAVLSTWLSFTHDLAATGFANAQRSFMGQSVSATFDSTTANMCIGLSVNAGASASWTFQQCYTELVNLDVQ